MICDTDKSLPAELTGEAKQAVARRDDRVRKESPETRPENQRPPHSFIVILGSIMSMETLFLHTRYYYFYQI
jgi:hypothetical protein